MKTEVGGADKKTQEEDTGEDTGTVLLSLNIKTKEPSQCHLDNAPPVPNFIFLIFYRGNNASVFGSSLVCVGS